MPLVIGGVSGCLTTHEALYFNDIAKVAHVTGVNMVGCLATHEALHENDIAKVAMVT
jgi:hypothetical protein